jgi:phosphatidate cytidylyltransferase
VDASLSSRIGTAAVILPVLVLLIGWSPPWLFSSVLFIVMVAALREYFAMAFPRRAQEQCAGILFGVALSGTIFLSERLDAMSWLGALFISIFSASIFAPGALNDRLQRLLWMLLGGIYAGFLFSHWLLVFRHPNGRAWVFWTLSVVMAGDTFAYLVGQRWGERKLAPAISPGKTIAGAGGYMAGAVVFGFAAAAVLFERFVSVEIIGLAVAVGILGQLGDLFESWLKRVFAVKDSSHLLPGHGGLLDRVDSLIFPAVFTSTYLRVFHS